MSNSPAYPLFILSVSVWAILTIAAEHFLTLSPDTRIILHVADTVACGIFFVDFLVTLKEAPDKRKYLLTWGWLDLISSIPAVGPLRYGRLGRVFRVLRILRAFRAVSTISKYMTSRRAQSAFLAAVLASLILLTAASILILKVETAPNSNIRDAYDAMWWAMSTITTVGSGDAFPVTGEGRLIGAFVMAAGVAIFGIFSGVAASWFLSAVSREQEAGNREQEAGSREQDAGRRERE